MKSALRFLASTLTVGVVALLPILLCHLLLGQLVDLVLVLSTRILDLLPDLSFAGLTDRQLVAVVLLVALLLVVGLIAQTRIGQRTGTWFERTFLGRLPLYELLRSLASRLSGAEDVVRFPPVSVTVRPGVLELGFIVEDSADGAYTVFIPRRPPRPGLSASSRRLVGQGSSPLPARGESGVCGRAERQNDADQRGRATSDSPRQG